MGTDTGLIGSILGPAREGAEIWANYVNQHGGLNCHKVNLITDDDGGDPSTALSEVQTMVQQDHVIAFIANANVLTTPTIAPYLAQVKVPTIGGTDYETQWFTNADFFPSGAGLRLLVDGPVKAGIAQGYTKVGVVACVEFALICSDGANILQTDTSSLGGQLVYNVSASIAQPDFTSECLGAKAAGVNNFFVAMDPASLDRLTQDCANQGYYPHYSAGGLAMVPTVLSTPDTVGVLAAGSIFPFPVVAPATAQFDQAVQQTTGGAPNSEFYASAWVAGLILQAASKNLPANNPSASDVLNGLDQIKNDDFGGLTSPITYVQGQPTASPTCYFLIQVVKGGFSGPDGLNPQCLPSSYAPVINP
jgi:branched-chain amino acid transport system substrate-binding protein